MWLDLQHRRATEPSSGERGRCGICCFWQMGRRCFNCLTVFSYVTSRGLDEKDNILNLRILENPTSLLVLSPTPSFSISSFFFSEYLFLCLYPVTASIPLSTNIFCPLLFCCHSADTAHPFFFLMIWALKSAISPSHSFCSVYSITRPGPPLPRYRRPRYQRHIPQMQLIEQT